MTVSWNGRQLKGCPLQINVTSAADASRVICSGDGLKHGIVGQEIRSFIDTRRAGPGEKTYFFILKRMSVALDISPCIRDLFQFFVYFKYFNCIVIFSRCLQFES